MRQSTSILLLALMSLCLAAAVTPAQSAPEFQGEWHSTCPLDSTMWPVDVSVTPTDEVVVCQHIARGERFAGTGACLSHWYIRQDDSPLFSIAVTPNGGTVVLAGAARKLSTFDAAGAPLATWGTFGVGAGQLEYPAGVEVSLGGEILVGDYGRQRVLVFTTAGQFVREWIPPVIPNVLAADDSGYIYVASSLTGQVAMCREDGTFVRHIARQGTSPGRVSAPSGIAVSADGLIYVSDYANNMISIFTRAGVFLERFGGDGGGPGLFNGVGGMDFDSLGNLYVVDENNLRICKFGPGPSPSTRRSWGQLKVMHR